MDSNNLPTAYEEIGPTRLSTSTEQQSPKRSAKTVRLIAELGLRYRPSAQADLEAHAAMLALLSKDLGWADPAKLERAIEKWVRSERFMPRASELIKLMEAQPKRPLREIADESNAALEAKGRHDIHWIVDGDDLRLETK